MITSFDVLFWFFTSLGIAYLIDRSKIIRKSWPEGFDLKSNTSYPVGTELRVSTIEKELRDWIGHEPDMVGQYFLDNNQITSADIVICKKSTELLDRGELFSVEIDAPLLKLEINGSEDRFKDIMNNGVPQIINLTISSKVTSFATLSNLHIRSLVLTEQCDIGAIFFINNCWIHNLVIEKQTGSSQKSTNTVIIKNSFIGVLNVDEACCEHFNMSCGGIRGIVCPSPEKQNPFRSSFHLDNEVFLQPKEDMFWLKQNYIQAYRNLRQHIKKFVDVESESLLYVQEMRLERVGKTPTVRFIYLIYDVISSYGTSPERVLAWLAGIFGYSSLLFFVYEGGTLLDASNINGWRKILCGNETLNVAARSIYLSAQSMFNPLYLFSKQSFIEPSSAIFVAWTMLQSLSSIILIAVLIITIRKLFKFTQ